MLSTSSSSSTTVIASSVRRALQLLVLLLLAIPSGSWSQEIRVGEANPPDTWDPFSTEQGLTGRRICSMIYEPLYRVMDLAAEAVPVLADTSWWVDRDAGKYRVRLKRGVKWHDGTPFDASDVAYSYEVARQAASSSKLQKVVNASVQRQGEVLRGVQVVSSDVVEFRFSKAQGDPKYQLELPIIPEHVFKRGGHLFSPCLDASQAVGTGPYKVRASQNVGVLLRSFPEYHGPRPALQPSVMYVPHEVSRFTQLTTGGLEFVSEIPPGRSAEIKASPNLRLISYPSYQVQWLAVNFENDVLRVPELRQALMYSMKRKLMLDSVLAGEGEIIDGPYARVTSCSGDSLIDYYYDEARAKQLVELAGLFNVGGRLETASGKPVVLRIAAYYPTQDQETDLLMQEILQSFRALGIDAQLDRSRSKQEFDEKVFDGSNWDLALVTWAFEPAPNFATVVFGETGNHGHYSNPIADQMMRSILDADSSLIRLKYCRLLDKLLNEDLPCLFLWTRVDQAVVNQSLRVYENIHVRPLTVYDTLYEWIESN